MRARVPADIDMADRILGGFTARQVAVLGVAVAVILALWWGIGRHLSPLLFLVVAAPVGAIGLGWATTSIEGTSAERVAASAARYFAQPRQHVLAPEGVGALPAWWRQPRERVAAFGLPARSIDEDGVISLGGQGTTIVCEATSINFGLRSEAEQEALVDGFGRLLNALDSPVQFLVRSERADVGSSIATLRNNVDGGLCPALQDAAREHAQFLDELSSRADVLRRRVFVCVRSPRSAAPGVNAVLEHRVDEAATLLRGLGIRLHRLRGAELAAVLACACDPANLSPAAEMTTQVVRGR